MSVCCVSVSWEIVWQSRVFRFLKGEQLFMFPPLQCDKKKAGFCFETPGFEWVGRVSMVSAKQLKPEHCQNVPECPFDLLD